MALSSQTCKTKRNPENKSTGKDENIDAFVCYLKCICVVAMKKMETSQNIKNRTAM